MKKYILIILILSTFHGFSKEKKPDEKDLKIDSLANVTVSLKIQLDSIGKEMTIYKGLYTSIKEKVLKQDFDPARFSLIIDSLRSGRDSTFSALNSTSEYLKDSLIALNKENDLIRAAIADEETKNKIVGELKQLKELLDAKILTFTEYDEMKKKVIVKWK